MPLLRQDGVLLRPFADTDAPLIEEVAADPLIPLITSVPTDPSRENSLAFIARQHDRLSSGAGYSFAVAESDTDEAVGQIGLWLDTLAHGRASVGYWIVDRRRGEGFARKALTIITEWGFTLVDVARIELYVEPWNTASWHTAESVGYEREGLLREWQLVGTERRDMYMYAKLRSAAGQSR